MTRHIRNLEHRLLQEVDRQLVDLGFAFQPRSQSFVRPIHQGRCAIHLSFIEHEADFDVTVDIAIRFDVVEEIVHRSNTLLSKKEKARTYTLGAEIGNLRNGVPFRLTVEESADVVGVADTIADIVREVGLPYINKYSRMEDAYDLMSRDDREVWVHSPIHAERAKRVCAMLVAMGRLSEVQVTGYQKLAFLRSLEDPAAPLFEQFLSGLVTSMGAAPT